MAYDNLTLGSLISEKELQFRNSQIYNNTLIGEPTGITAQDGSPLLKLVYITDVMEGDTSALKQNKETFNGIFGSALISNRKPEFSANFTYPLDERDAGGGLTGSASISYQDSLITLETGTTPGSVATIQSKRNLRYVAGRDAEIMFTLSLNNGGFIGTTQRVGLFNGENGFALGYNGVDFSIFRKYNNVWVDEIPQSNFNIDTLDGNGASNFNLDPTKLNIYRITYGYLGIAPIYYQVYGGFDKGWITFHIIDLTNQQNATHVLSPYLPIKAELDNGATSEDLKAQSGSIYAGVFGGSGLNPDVSARYFSATTGVLGTYSSPTEDFIVSFHNKTTFNGILNRIENLLQVLTVAADFNKSVEIRLYKTGAPTGGVWLDVDTNNSNLEYNLTGSYTITAADELLSVWTTSSIGDIYEDVSKLQLLLYPDEYALFTVSSSGNGELTLAIREAELF